VTDFDPCPICRNAVHAIGLLTSLPADTPPDARPGFLSGEIDERSSILTLEPCGCHVLGQVRPTIATLLAAARRQAS
jgi:hypothetical protein